MGNEPQIKKSGKGVVFEPPLHIRESGEDDEVIVFGTSSMQDEDDLTKGISRFGGWRSPDYTKAYLRAARTLVASGLEKNDLDNLGLPIFYLQRHSVELFIKELLNLFCDIAVMRHALYGDDESKKRLPSERVLDRLAGSHDLKQLHKDLKDCAERNSFKNCPKDVPEEIGQLVEIIMSYEEHHTWSRYPNRKYKKEKKVFENRTWPVRLKFQWWRFKIGLKK